MSINENNDIDSKNIIRLTQSKALQQSGLVTDSVYYIDTHDIKISLNHKACTDIIFTIDFKKWQKNLDTIEEMAEEYGIHDTESKKLLKIHLNDNYDTILTFSTTITNSDKNEEEKSKPKIITTFKYSQLGKSDLYDVVFIKGGLPIFIKYNDKTNEFEKTEQIEETTRILVPPTLEECPYLPYEFESLDEINNINKFIENNNIGLDYFYNKGYEIVSKYNNQSVHKLRLATIKIITSHFQDRFPTTEYLYLVGGNGSGKSSLAETFRALAYKTVVMTDPSAPNIFRLLGIVEPVQCTMVLEEADKIDKIPELMAVLKTGYSYYGSVSKINPYTLKQEFFYTYCPKIIVSERSLNHTIAKGVNSRTFPINCIKGSTKYDIKEILNPTNTGGSENKQLLQEIKDFRKLLLVYRLRHFKDPIPDLDIGVEGRDKELVKHSIQLFYGCKCLNEVIETLQYFLDIKNEKKESSLESILLSIVSTLVKHNGSEISSKSIWNELMEEIPGTLNEKNPNEYHTNDYGTIYRTTTVSGYLGDSFGGISKHTRGGNIWIFDRETILSLATEDKSRIRVSEVKIGEENVGEGVNTVNTPDIGWSINLQKSELKKEDEEEDQEKDHNTDKTGSEESIRFIDNNNNKNKNIENSDNSLSQMPSPYSPIHLPSEEDKQQEQEHSSIHRTNPYSDIWKCDNCNWTGDVWFMKNHPCKNNRK